MREPIQFLQDSFNLSPKRSSGVRTVHQMSNTHSRPLCFRQRSDPNRW